MNGRYTIHAEEFSYAIPNPSSFAISLSARPFRTYHQEQEIAWSLTVPNNPKAEMKLQSTVVYWLRVMHQVRLLGVKWEILA